MNLLRIAAIAAVSTLALNMSAQAALITFDEEGTSNGVLRNPYHEDGFTFSPDGRVFIIPSNIFGSELRGVEGGFAYLEALDDVGAAFDVTADSGALFNASGVQVTVRDISDNGGVSARLRFEGVFEDGSIITRLVDAVDNAIATDILLGFENLVSLRIVAENTSGLNFPVFDKLTLTEVPGAATPVPLPAALPLFLAGLAGFGAVGRKKRKSA